MSNTIRYTVLAGVLILIVGAIWYLDDSMTGVSRLAEIAPLNTAPAKDARYPRAKEIVTPGGFINTEGAPIVINELIGKKVILVDFLTYSCINCVRVQPYLNAWHEKYKDQGLQIIGIHTPEFEFEKDIKNVAPAMRDMGVKYPVVLDNEYGTWRAYQNSYWPRKYLIDIDGYIVYDHIGEGGYEETEYTIQQLLRERAERQPDGMPVKVAGGFASPEGVESVSDPRPRTPEIYFGAWRNTDYLANPKPGTGQKNFVAPETLEIDKLYLDGPWTIEQEYATGVQGSSIKLRYQAKKVFMVASSEQGADLKVLLDGKLLKTIHVKGDELYRLVESEAWGEHTLELIIDGDALQAFTFTFG